VVRGFLFVNGGNGRPRLFETKIKHFRLFFFIDIICNIALLLYAHSTRPTASLSNQVPFLYAAGKPTAAAFPEHLKTTTQ
jgi:hypothetical protein